MVNLMYFSVPYTFLNFMDEENFLQRTTDLCLQCRGSTFLKEFKRKLNRFLPPVIAYKRKRGAAPKGGWCHHIWISLCVKGSGLANFQISK